MCNTLNLSQQHLKLQMQHKKTRKTSLLIGIYNNGCCLIISLFFVNYLQSYYWLFIPTYCTSTLALTSTKSVGANAKTNQSKLLLLSLLLEYRMIRVVLQWPCGAPGAVHSTHRVHER